LMMGLSTAKKCQSERWSLVSVAQKGAMRSLMYELSGISS